MNLLGNSKFINFLVFACFKKLIETKYSNNSFFPLFALISGQNLEISFESSSKQYPALARSKKNYFLKLKWFETNFRLNKFLVVIFAKLSKIILQVYWFFELSLSTHFPSDVNTILYLK